MHLGCDDVRYGNATLNASVRGFAPPKTRGASLCLRLDTPARRGVRMDSQRFPFCSRQPTAGVGFVSFGLNGHRQTAAGMPDSMLEQHQALPPPLELQRCQRCETAPAESHSLQHALHALAEPRRVHVTRTAAFLAVREYGAGATIHALVLAVLDALGRNETLFSPKLLLWAQPEACERADLSCFFASLPSLDTVGTGSSGPVVDGLGPRQWRRLMDAWFGKHSAHQLRNTHAALPTFDKLHVKLRPRLLASKHRGASACRHTQTGCPRLLPAHFSETTDEASVMQRLPTPWLRRGRFWLVSQVLQFLTRPNFALQQRLTRARAELRFAEHQPVLAVHVRKGDACTHRGECRGLAGSMPQIEQMAASYGFRSIFLATPSADVLEETTRYPQFRWLFLNTTRTQAAGGARIEDALLQGRVQALREWQDFMLEVYLMSESQALVGAFSSNAVRLAYSLMATNAGGCLKPFISTDINWCHAFFRGGPEVLRRGDAPARVEQFPSIKGITC